MNAGPSELGGYASLQEPTLLFYAGGGHRHPLSGLIQHGPYGQNLRALSALRFALLAPQRDIRTLEGLIAELKGTARPKEARNYYPEYPGFEALFRLPVADQDQHLEIPFPPNLDNHAQGLAKAETAHLRIFLSRLSEKRRSRGNAAPMYCGD